MTKKLNNLNVVQARRQAMIDKNLGRKTGWKFVEKITLSEMGHCTGTGARMLHGAIIKNAKTGKTMQVGVGFMLKYTDAKLPVIVKVKAVKEVKAIKASRKVAAPEATVAMNSWAIGEDLVAALA